MGKNFTLGFNGIRVLFFLIVLISSTLVKAQNCIIPANPYISNLSNFTVTLNWDSVYVANHYRIRYQEIGASTWINKNNIIPAHKKLVNLTQNTIYQWQVRSYCSAGNSGWSVSDTFQTANFPLDCDGAPNGSAWIDSCGNCVGGNTFAFPCIPFPLL